MKCISMAFLGLLFCAPLPSSAATDAELDCSYQSDVVQAIRQARLDRVKERDVPEAIEAAAPSWPDKYDAVVTLVAPWVYEMKLRDVKTDDLAAAWKEMCLAR